MTTASPLRTLSIRIHSDDWDFSGQAVPRSTGILPKSNESLSAVDPVLESLLVDKQ
jgi:hypothetical protein